VRTDLLQALRRWLRLIVRSNKAVADGGVSYFIDRHVSARVSRYFYGVTMNIQYDETDREHIRRASSRYVNSTGYNFLPGRFDIILPKVNIF
jgi:hypothetical protein